MRNVLKPFGERGIGLLPSHFQWSRIALAVIYVAMLAMILFSSAGITRYFFSERLRARLDAYQEALVNRPGRAMPPRADEVRKDLEETSAMVNITLLVLSGVLSYVLAGITLRPIQVAYRKQQQLLSDAAHELRTPLAILQTNLENERDVAPNDAARGVTESYLEEVGRMSALVNDLLLVSRFDQRSVPLLESSVVLYPLVQQCVERLQSFAAKHEVSLHTVGTIEGKYVVHAPSTEVVMRAFTNIIQNAIVYNKKGGKVEVVSLVRGKFFVVTVRDTGVGIAPDETDRVFDRFYRAEKSRSRQRGGSGLGLPIAQSIFSSIGGTISLKSVVDQGTEVTITIPVHKAS
jgi:signal transduction histidine kinase